MTLANLLAWAAQCTALLAAALIPAFGVLSRIDVSQIAEPPRTQMEQRLAKYRNATSGSVTGGKSAAEGGTSHKLSSRHYDQPAGRPGRVVAAHRLPAACGH